MRPIEIGEDHYCLLSEESYKYICSCIQILTKLSDAIDDNNIGTSITWSSDKINSIVHDIVQERNVVEHSLQEINAWLNITDQELETYRQLIDDDVVLDDKTWSSVKIATLIDDLELRKAEIDDLTRTVSKTWSSKKIMTEITNKIYKLEYVEVNINDDKEYLIPLENACKLTVQEGGKIILPTVPAGESVEIHILFEGDDLAVFTMPQNVKWQDGIKPVLFSNKTYELILQYVDDTVGWLGCFMTYSL